MGVVTLIYDHHAGRVAERLTELQHLHLNRVVTTTHVHLDAHRCLEVILLRGPAKIVRELADSLIGTKGVETGRLVLASATPIPMATTTTTITTMPMPIPTSLSPRSRPDPDLLAREDQETVRCLDQTNRHLTAPFRPDVMSLAVFRNVTKRDGFCGRPEVASSYIQGAHA